MIRVKIEDLLVFAQGLVGQELHTLHRRRPFRIIEVDVAKRAVFLEVGSSGKLRKVSDRWLQKTCEIFSRTNSYHPMHYTRDADSAWKGTQGVSYSLALISRFVQSKFNDAAIEDIEKSYANSQGFQLDSKLRKAVEDYVMNAAKRHFKSQGYEVEDRSKNGPYDLRCTRKKELLYVEVKGTQTQGEDIILTSGEVQFARRNKANMALFILHSIKISEKDKSLTNGTISIIVPWDVDEGNLVPISFCYKVPKHSTERK
ncbi:MAG: hypothetical protein KatS3mg105_0383 [Gemmatales bacterium]|nr:MAG: hypothetical protein KatS3mg105_0383 [Gemmatales bacterium]